MATIKGRELEKIFIPAPSANLSGYKRKYGRGKRVEGKWRKNIQERQVNFFIENKIATHHTTVVHLDPDQIGRVRLVQVHLLPLLDQIQVQGGVANDSVVVFDHETVFVVDRGLLLPFLQETLLVLTGNTEDIYGIDF